MNYNKASALLIIIIVAFASSCSRKKNTFVSRNLHAVGTEYNVLYNGYLALDAGLQELEQTYQDNYWEVLPVERLKDKEALFTPGQKENNANFERAEEKAVKAVQKHSMLIDGAEYNPQIDEAYMLLGKARYFDQRYLPSLEAFNYILQFMPESDQLTRAKIWKQRANMRLDNNETAIFNLKKLLQENLAEFNKEDLATANATLSQAFLNMQMVDSALVYMYKAANQTENRDTEGRYKFIAGQLFARAGQKDSALAYYDRVIKLHRKIPRNYYVNAFIEKIKLFDTINGDKLALMELLDDLEKNRENRPWLDDIYSRKAIYYEWRDNTAAATDYYNRSLRENRTPDPYLRANNYTALGNINFNDAQYVRAGKYFDSAIANYTKRTVEYRGVKKKRDNLEDVIFYELRRRSADSIFKVVAMGESEREAYYQEYIDTLIAREKRLEEEAAIAAANQAQNGKSAFQNVRNNNNKLARLGGNGNKNKTPATPMNLNTARIGPGSFTNQPSTFYFYNPQTIARGKQDFERKWGRRELRDNWRVSSKVNTAGDILKPDAATVDQVEEQRPEHTTPYYTDKLPTTQATLDSIAVARDQAYYKLGVIYKEKFKRNDLAVDRFETLLDFEPADRLVLPSLYNLYLIYKESAFAKAEQLKNRIIAEYPDTRYAQLLKNPASKSNDDSSPDAVYKRLYRSYDVQDYLTTINEADKYIELFSGDGIVPRLKLLKAFASGRLYGVESYRSILDDVALNYPNTPFGKSAQQLLEESKKLAIKKSFTKEDKLTDFKLIFKFNKGDTAIVALQEKITNFLADKNFDFTISIDRYDEQTTLLVVHGLGSRLGATGLITALMDSDYEIEENAIPIATANYKTIQAYKNLNDYEISVK
ncbi:MAG: hypothetical protein WBA16_00850 [Nonlabens sp.]